MTGEGQWIDAALYESAFRVMEFSTTFYGRQKVVRERGGVQHAGWPGGAFETLDGKWIVFTAPAQHLFDRLCAMIGQPDLPKEPRFASAAERPKHIPEIIDMMTAWFQARPFEKAVAELTTADIPHSPIMSMADIFTDPHYRARDMIIDVPDETLGTLSQPGVVPKLSLTPGRVTHAGATMGRHTDEILADLLGMSAEAIAALRAENVI
jgi:crotonobetainyl-CoA:carnitine CoA-transferase CaiB-like acyl-CoA transferase